VEDGGGGCGGRKAVEVGQWWKERSSERWRNSKMRKIHT
jgi:hypothetical protein